MYMGGEDQRDDATYIEDVKRLAKTLLNLLDRKKPKAKEIPAPSGRVVKVPSSLAESPPVRPRSRLAQLSRGAGRDMRQLSDLPDGEVIMLAKRGGRILRPGDVAKVRSTAGRNGSAADIIDAMDQNGLFDS